MREKSPSCPTWALAFGAGRVLRWLLVRASRLTHSSAAFPRDGGNAGGEAAQRKARRKTAALFLPPPAGVAPYSKRGTMPRTIYRRTGAAFAYGFGYFRASRSNRSPRGGRTRDTAPHDDRTRGGALRFERRGVRLESVGFGRVERVERGASFGWLVNAPHHTILMALLYQIDASRATRCVLES